MGSHAYIYIYIVWHWMIYAICFLFRDVLRGACKFHLYAVTHPASGLRPALPDLQEAASLFLVHCRPRGKPLPSSGNLICSVLGCFNPKPLEISIACLNQWKGNACDINHICSFKTTYQLYNFGNPLVMDLIRDPLRWCCPCWSVDLERLDLHFLKSCEERTQTPGTRNSSLDACSRHSDPFCPIK